MHILGSKVKESVTLNFVFGVFTFTRSSLSCGVWPLLVQAGCGRSANESGHRNLRPQGH